jgi:hypothetical protein
VELEIQYRQWSYLFGHIVLIILFGMQVCGLASAMMLASMAEREQTRAIYAAKLLLFQ